MTSTLPSPSQSLSTPQGYPIIGHALNYRLDPLKFYTRCAQEYGDFVRLQFGPYPVYFLNHPDLIKEVFVTKGHYFLERAEGREVRFFDPLFGNGLATSRGSFWQRQRKLTQSAFHRNRFAGYGDITVALTEQAIANWQPGDGSVAQRDLTNTLRKIIMSIVFGQEGATQVSALEEVMVAAIKEYDRRKQNWLLGLLPETIPTPGNLRYHRAVENLDQWLYRIIETRRKTNEDQGDMISILMQVRDENGQGMNDLELRDELVNILLPHDSMGDALTWAWWLIAQHPEVEDKLVAEWQSVLGGRSPTFEDIPKLRYTEAVMMETLRLYPLAWVTGRIATEDCEIGGYPIHAGENVVMCQWVTHRDRRFFEQPDMFNPDRWSNEATKRTPNYAYYPFGGGARVCIGRGLAMMETVLILATIGQKFHFEPLPGQTIVPYPNPSFSLRPKYGIKMQLVSR